MLLFLFIIKILLIKIKKNLLLSLTNIAVIVYSIIVLIFVINNNSSIFYEENLSKKQAHFKFYNTIYILYNNDICWCYVCIYAKV